MIKPTNKITGKLNASIIHVYPELENIEITPTVEDQTYTPTKYGFEEVKVKGVQAYIDEDIKPEYIKDGVDILGVIGNVVELQGEEKTISPSTTQQIIVPSDGKNGITKLTVEAVDSSIDENIKPENIKEGTNILGIYGQYRGTDTTDATATAEDITAGKTAYVNGEKITGTSTKIDTTDATATAEDILTGKTAYVNGAKIEGTLTPAEDLQEQLDAQDLIIQQLQEELAGKASGGEVKPNVFMQEAEPTTKDGIWLKGSYQVDNIIADENIFAGEEWNTTKMSSLKATPYGFVGGSAITVETNIYLFGGSFGNTTAYKYDTLTDTYTKLKDIPYEFSNGSAALVGTNIYLFGGSGSNTISKTAYKYDILTDTYTQLTNIPYSFYYGPAVSVGTNVYLFGSVADSSYHKTAYKYDTLKNTYTQLTNIPYNFYNSSAVSVGTNVYLFGSGKSSYSKTAYKYDTVTDTYTKLTNIPYSFYHGSAVSVGINVYLFGGSGDYTTAYKYDILTNTYTQLTNIPYEFYRGSAVSVGTNVYLFGGEFNRNKVQVLTMIPNDYGNNSIVISQGVPNNKTNISNSGIQNAKSYYDYDRVYYQDENGELLTTIPTYNGNGEEWVKISGGEG